MTIKFMGILGLLGMLTTATYACKEDLTCVSGKQEPCPCANGINGVQTCSGGNWAACDCAGVLDGDIDADTDTDVDVDSDADADSDADCADTVDDFGSCLECYCEDEMATCDGDDDCLDLLSCLNDCTDDVCQTACAEEFPDGVAPLIDVLDCRDENCSDYLTDTGCEADVTDFDTCLSCYCDDEIGVCEANSDCVDLLYCLNDCADSACEDTCLADFADGVDDLFGVLDCRDSNCAGYLTDPTECAADVVDFETCLSCYCDGYLTTCEANADCLDLLYCLGDCADTDTACQDDCITNYADGVTPLINVLDCRDANCTDYMS